MSTAPRPGTPSLVFGDDGSAAADLAWGWITAQRWTGWDARVVTAVEPDLVRPAPAGDAVLRPWSPAMPRVAPDECSFRAVVHLTATRDPRLVLSEPADLVVIGPRGRGAWEAMHLGSTAEWLATVPANPTVVAREAVPARRVLACVDGSVHAARAVAALASLPFVAEAEVALLAVADNRTDPADAIGPAQAALAGTGASISAVERRGRPTEVVMDEITARLPDLVVLGTRGRTGWKRMRTGSTATTVLRRATPTLLVAHEPDAE